MKLVVAEKPSVGKTIQSVVGDKDYIVTWCFGHLVESAPPDAYGEQYAERPWKLSALPCIPGDWKYDIKNESAAQYKVVKDLMNRADITEIICATDAGREGELIFRNVYNMARCKKPVKRLWISSMENAAIAEGFRNLRDSGEYDNLYAAAYCRDRADWLVGMNATRLFTSLYHTFISVGRVVSPTLNMIVQRHLDIVSFIKEPFYVPEFDFGGVILSAEKYDTRAEAEAVSRSCEGKTATVTKIVRKEKSEKPPKLYDLTTLQREANKAHGYTAAKTLDIIQSLYEKQLATYPRTDSRYITEDMQANVSDLAHALEPNAFCDTSQIADNSKVSDHHAIIPTLKGIAAHGLPEQEANILSMLKKRLIEAVGERHLYNEIEIILSCDGIEYSFKGKSLVYAGWKKQTEYKPIPDWSEGQTLEGIPRVREGFTSPPKPYTEDTLLAAMETAGVENMPEDAERRGIGTPATRAAIIEKLTSAGKDGIPFVERVNKSLKPTDKGINAVKVLPESLKSPLMTAEWEHKLSGINKGELSAGTFLREIENFVRVLVSDNQTAASGVSLQTQRTALGKCPLCRSDVFTGKSKEGKVRYYCSNKSCNFVIWGEIAGKSITSAQAGKLLDNRKSDLIKGFKSKAGSSFDAYLTLTPEGKVEFVFPQR